MLNVYVYSHSDFNDVLTIQSDKLSKILNKCLFINKNCNNIEQLFKYYRKVYFYDDIQPYASRLIAVLSQITDEYILLTHDNDIFVEADWHILNKFVAVMQKHNIDRIDLQCNGGNTPHNNMECIEICNNKNGNEWGVFSLNSNILNTSLAHHNVRGTYQYNVQPSIWNVSSLLKILKQHPLSTYRSIETDVLDTIMAFNIYNLISPNYLRAGYLKCTNLYKYLHITRHGKLLRYDSSAITECGHSYEDLYNDYRNIIEEYDLLNGNRKFN